MAPVFLGHCPRLTCCGPFGAGNSHGRSEFGGVGREVSEFPRPKEDGNPLRSDDWELLRDVCEGDEVLFDLQVALLGVEQKFRGMAPRVGVIEALEKCLNAAVFEDEKDAFAVLTERDQRLKRLKDEDEGSQGGQMVLFSKSGE